MLVLLLVSEDQRRARRAARTGTHLRSPRDVLCGLNGSLVSLLLASMKYLRLARLTTFFPILLRQLSSTLIVSSFLPTLLWSFSSLFWRYNFLKARDAQTFSQRCQGVPLGMEACQLGAVPDGARNLGQSVSDQAEFSELSEVTNLIGKGGDLVVVNVEFLQVGQLANLHG